MTDPDHQEVKDTAGMSPEAQQTAIAEACGELEPHTTKPTIAELEAMLNDPTPRIVTILPNGEVRAVRDYLFDLNAMHEAEKVLPGFPSRAKCKYFDHLNEVCRRAKTDSWCATASQRAEAFLRTLGKWSVSEGDHSPRVSSKKDLEGEIQITCDLTTPSETDRLRAALQYIRDRAPHFEMVLLRTDGSDVWLHDFISEALSPPGSEGLQVIGVSVEDQRAHVQESIAKVTRQRANLEIDYPSPANTMGQTSHIIGGRRLGCLIANAHALLRTKYKHSPLWAMVGDLTGHGSTLSIEICHQSDYDPYQKCSVMKLARLSPDVSEKPEKEKKI